MKLILIDGYGFVFRAFHSLPPLTRQSDKKPIGAVYGFINMILKLLKSHEFDHLAIVLDSGGENFRHELFPDYKAHRPAPPEDLVVQFPMIREAAEAFGIKVLEREGCEADDLIASYTKAAIKDGYEVVIVSSDKDLLQLVGGRVSLYDAVKDRYLDEKYCLEKFGIKCEQVRDFLALVGDSADNIPGVKGIGLKAAKDLICEYGDIDTIYASIDNITPPRRKQLLIEGKENALLSRRLIELADQLELMISLNSLKFSKIDEERLVHYLQKQGFKTLLAKFDIKPEASNDYFEVKSKQELLSHMETMDVLYFWLHGTHLYLSYRKKRLKCLIGASVQANLFEEGTHSLTSYLDVLAPFFEDKCVRKITLKLKDTLRMGYKMNNAHDLEVMAYSLLTRRNGYSFDDLHEKYGDALEKQYKAMITEMCNHSCATLYNRMDRMMPQIVAEMEERGVCIDADFLKQLSTEFQKHLHDIESVIYKKAGCEFNVASPKQLKDILNNVFKLKINSTSVEVLEDLVNQGYDIASDILKHRHFHKLLTTYTEALPKSINHATGRVHTTFNFTSTATARFSSTNPNLQNLPIRSEEGGKIRAAIRAKAGHSIISADYSQIELRLLAHFADIPSLKQAFLNGEDIHAATARDMFGVKEVDSELRRRAKTINFGIIYGISAFGLASRLDIPKAQAQAFIDHYFVQYPGIKQYMDDMIAYAKNHGYVQSLFGRRCEINDINASNFNLRKFAERVAINAPLQSSSADIIRKAMCDLPQELRKYLILQVHDELLFEVPDTQIDELSKMLKFTMENVCTLSIPLIASVSHGKNWAECK